MAVPSPSAPKKFRAANMPSTQSIPRARESGWSAPKYKECAMKTAAILVARRIFAGVFAMAAGFKFADMNATAEYIASIGFPAPLLFAWLAAFFEIALVIAFLTGLFFSEASLLATAYVLFLAFAFHGPAHWTGNQTAFGFFFDHFTFIAGLLFAAVHGPGSAMVLRRGGRGLVGNHA